jgi:hypothetical protein
VQVPGSKIVVNKRRIESLLNKTIQDFFACPETNRRLTGLCERYGSSNHAHPLAPQTRQRLDALSVATDHESETTAGIRDAPGDFS